MSKYYIKGVGWPKRGRLRKNISRRGLPKRGRSNFKGVAVTFNGTEKFFEAVIFLSLLSKVRRRKICKNMISRQKKREKEKGQKKLRGGL